MRASISILLLALSSASGFVPALNAGASPSVAPLSATPTSEPATTIRKRDKVKNAVRKVLRKEKEPTSVKKSPTPLPRGGKMKAAQNGSKYENIENLEEKAYQILKDLDMI